MEREKLMNEIVDILRESLMLGEQVIEPNNELEQYGVDSMALVELSMQLEEKYNISIDDFALVNIKTLNEAVDAIQVALQDS